VTIDIAWVPSKKDPGWSHLYVYQGRYKFSEYIGSYKIT
jgi:hypothetical protein